MFGLVCLTCQSLHHCQKCPHCGGLEHLVILLEDLPWQPRVENVTSTFESVPCKDTCAICYDEMLQGIVLPCGHQYHKDCISPWIHKHFTCPTCRQSILKQRYQSSGPNGFQCQIHTEPALEELDRVTRLYRRHFKSI